MANLNYYVTNFAWLFALLIIWTMIWKGLALWKAATNRQSVWFIILFIINTLGILDIIYLFAVKTKKNSTPSLNNQTSTQPY